MILTKAARAYDPDWVELCVGGDNLWLDAQSVLLVRFFRLLLDDFLPRGLGHVSSVVRVKRAPRSLLAENASLGSDRRELDFSLSLRHNGRVFAIAGGRLRISLRAVLVLLGESDVVHD